MLNTSFFRISSFFWKRNHKIIIYFTLGIVIYSILASLLIINIGVHIVGYKLPVFDHVENVVIKDDNQYFSINIFSMSYMLKYAFFSGPMIIYFIIFSLVLFCKNFNNEIKNNTMSILMSCPFSRKKILISKVINIIFAKIILLIIMFIFILSLTLYGHHNSKNILNLFLFFVEFVIFIALLSSLIFLTSSWCAEKTALFITIISLFCLYIFIIYLLNIIKDNGGQQQFNFLKFINYFDITKIVINPLDFKMSGQITEEIINPSIDTANKTIIISYFENKEYSSYLYIVFFFINIIIILVSNFFGMLIFDKKDLKI